MQTRQTRRAQAGRRSDLVAPTAALGMGMGMGLSIASSVIMATAGLLFGCSRASDSAGVTLTISGSSTLAPLVAELAHDYEQAHPDVRIDVQSGGSSRGVLDVRNGLAAIGMVSRDLGEEEQDLQVYLVARDGVGIIVHARNPVSALSSEQIAALYRGRIQSWRELGGPQTGGETGGEAGIVVVHKAEGRATRAVFLEHFGLDGSEIEADVVVGENEQVIKTVARSPNAIGYVSIATATIDIASGVPIRLVAVDGVEATLANLRSGRYPIARPLNLITREPVSGLARDFLAFVRSAEARPRFEALQFLQVAP